MSQLILSPIAGSNIPGSQWIENYDKIAYCKAIHRTNNHFKRRRFIDLETTLFFSFSKVLWLISNNSHVQKSAPSSAHQTAPWGAVIFLLLLRTYLHLHQYLHTVLRFATVRALAHARHTAAQARDEELAVTVYWAQTLHPAPATAILVAT